MTDDDEPTTAAGDVHRARTHTVETRAGEPEADSSLADVHHADVPQAGDPQARTQHDAPVPFFLRPMNSRTKRVTNTVLTILVPLGIIWFAWANWDTLTAGPWDFTITLLLASIVFYLVSEGLRPVGWHMLMREAGERPPIRNTLFVWFAMEPLQYLPLPLGPFAGRYVLADRVGIPPTVALVTQVYAFALFFTLPQLLNFPALVWLATQAEGLLLTVAVVFLAASIAAFAYGTLRRGGVTRTIREALGPEYRIEDVEIPRRRLAGPALVEFLAYVVRITGAGLLLASLTPVDLWKVPFYGLLFGAAAAVPLGRFGTREVAITIALGIAGVPEGPALLSAVASRALGLSAALVWLGGSYLAGGSKPPTRPGVVVAAD